MSVQAEINARTAKLKEILAGANASIAEKNGAAAANLNGLPAAIESIPASEPELQVKGVTPNGNAITVTPDSGYDGLSAVNVAGDAYLVPENIAKDVTIYGVTGTMESADSIIWHDDFEIMPEAYDFPLTAPEGHGMRKIVVLGDEDLKPENIRKGVNLFNVYGTYEGGGNAIPEPYATYIAEAEAVYTGEYANVIYAEGYGAVAGVTYKTVMFLLDNWSITAYDAATTEYKHSGCYIVQKEDEGEWVLTDYSTTTAEEHYAKNIKAASLYIEYEGLTLFPVGKSNVLQGKAVNLFRNLSFEEKTTLVFDDVTNDYWGAGELVQGAETAHSGNCAARMKCTSAYEGDYSSDGLINVCAASTGHYYYFQGWMNQTPATSDHAGQIWLGYYDGVFGDYDTRLGKVVKIATKTGEWERLGGVLYVDPTKVEDTATQSAVIIFGVNVNINDTNARNLVDDVLVVDLTETFGAGNEPTAEECDTIFADYDGVSKFIDVEIFREATETFNVTAIDYSNWDNGSFSETLETGDTVEYAVEFDASKQPIEITLPDGATAKVTWEASE